MERNPVPGAVTARRSYDDVWRDESGYLRGLASWMLSDPTEAEDVVQDAFDRLARVELDEIDDVRGWLAVVVRRLCLDRIRSARSRRESVAGDAFVDAYASARVERAGDPADRVTLDEQIQRALAVVLDRLTPPERTAFVLHDVFGFPFDAVADIVGRTPVACRQLASRARRSVRSSPESASVGGETNREHALAERFIAACAGGDIAEVVALLDPDVDGEATMFGRGPLVTLAGRPAVAQRLLGFFGPATDTRLVAVDVEGEPGVVAFRHGSAMALVRLEAVGGVIRHLHALVLPPDWGADAPPSTPNGMWPT